jgi:hypothetical protein
MTNPCFDGKRLRQSWLWSWRHNSCHFVEWRQCGHAFLEFRVDGCLQPDINDATLTGFPGLSALLRFATSENISFDRISIPVPHFEQLLRYFDAATHFLKSGSSQSQSLLVLQLFTDREDFAEWETIHLSSLRIFALAGNPCHVVLGLLDPPKLHISGWTIVT